MRGPVAPLAVVALSLGACGLGINGGAGGGGGSGGLLRKAFVIPHILEKSGSISRVAVGDVNGDGILDLVELRESPSKGVALQLSTGLRESPSLPSKGKTSLARGALGYNPPSAHVLVWDTTADLGMRDMDGDSCPDLIVAGGAAHQVGVWRCDPIFRDEFLSPVLVNSPGSCDRVATGDVNGDGRCDLVTMDESTGQASVFLQTSSSPLQFTVDTSPPVISACHGLVVCDMDRDGLLDIVTNDPAGDRVVVLYGGAAGFKLRESPTKQSLGRAMAVGDVDGDGWLDVVVVSEDGKSVACLHQQPTSPRSFDEVDSPLGIAIDEPGVQVCQIAIDEPGVHFERSLDGGGGGGVGSLGMFRVRESPTRQSTCSQAGLGLADLDRDGRLDLVCTPAAGDPDRSVVVVFGSGSTRGGFGPDAERKGGKITGGINVDSGGLLLADLDNDGHLDIAESLPDLDALSLEYFENGDIPDPTGIQQTNTFDTSLFARSMAVADLDRDGMPDLVTATSAGLECRFQDPASPGTYSAPLTLLQGLDCRCVAVGDVNGDGCPDCVVGVGASGATVLRDPAVARGFQAPIPFLPPPAGIGALRSLVLSDCDGDGDLDLICIRESPSLPKLGAGAGQKNGFFDIFTEIDAGPGNWLDVATGDLDGDGRDDLVVCGESPDACAVLLNGHVTILKFGLAQPLLLQGGVRVATGDVNGDGRCDVVTCGAHGVTVALQSQDVPGRFLPGYSLDSEECGGLAVGDLDRDGELDLCFVETKKGAVVRCTGDPDFDLLRISLNGLPPGTPFPGVIILEADTDGDGTYEPLISFGHSGSTTGTIRMFGPGP
jgi:hypothetical protein